MALGLVTGENRVWDPKARLNRGRAKYMSYEDGWAAINLEMPKRVPRTEYSAEMHWDLIKAVTGIDVSVNSENQLKAEAQRAFRLAWNYDFVWRT